VPRDEELQCLHCASLSRDFILLLHSDFGISRRRSGPFAESFCLVRGCTFGHGNTPFTRRLTRIGQAHDGGEQRRRAEEGAALGISDHFISQSSNREQYGSSVGSRQRFDLVGSCNKIESIMGLNYAHYCWSKSRNYCWLKA